MSLDHLNGALFYDKAAIKPWLLGQLRPLGVHVVIERSDDSKIVFKCKAPAKATNSGVGAGASGAGANSAATTGGVTKPHTKKPRAASSCPFRIRANYSIRAKRWTVVVVNACHNHHGGIPHEGAPEYPITPESPRGESLPSLAPHYDMVGAPPIIGLHSGGSTGGAMGGPTGGILGVQLGQGGQRSPPQLPTPRTSSVGSLLGSLPNGHRSHLPGFGSGPTSSGPGASQVAGPPATASAVSLGPQIHGPSTHVPLNTPSLKSLHGDVISLLTTMNTTLSINDHVKERVYEQMILTMRTVVPQNKVGKYYL